VADGVGVGEALGAAESVAAGAELAAAARVGVVVALGEFPEVHAETVVRASPRPIPVTTNRCRCTPHGRDVGRQVQDVSDR
jgi:hypothetical protein